MKWRIIHRELHTGPMNMGIDEALAEMAAAEKSPPTIRFYSWNPPGISVGRFQRLREAVKTEKCSRMGIDYLRRMSGGGTACHSSEIAYSITAPGYVFPRYADDAFMLVCTQVASALASLGIKAEYRPLDEIMAGGKKIGWSAFTFRNGAVIFQGSVFYGFDFASMAAATGTSPAKLKEAVTCVKDFSRATENDLEIALEKCFIKGKEWKRGVLAKEELERAEELSERYSGREWNFSI